MTMTPEVRFLGLEPSAALEAAARDKAAKLAQFHHGLMSCRVSIELAHKHQHQGRPFEVRIDVTGPGFELCVDRVQHEDAHVALREAFDDMKRRLEDRVRRDRGQEKQHATPLHGETADAAADRGRPRG